MRRALQNNTNKTRLIRFWPTVLNILRNEAGIDFGDMLPASLDCRNAGLASKA